MILCALSSISLGAASLTWTGVASRDWNTTDTNWFFWHGTFTNRTAVPTNFSAGDSVFFSSDGSGDVFIGSNGTPINVAPTAVSFGGANNYRMMGGDITSGSLDVNGARVSFVGYSNSLSFPGGLKVGYYPSEVSFDLSQFADGASLHLGTGPIASGTAFGSSVLRFVSSNSGTYTIENDLSGIGIVILPDGTNVALRLTGTLSLDRWSTFHLSYSSQLRFATNEVAGPIIIDQWNSGERVLAMDAWYSAWRKDLRISGVISDGEGGGTNALRLVTYAGGIIIAASNTYAHGTYLRSSGAPPGPVIVLPGATLGTGDVDASLGMLVLTDAGNISPNATLKWRYQIIVTNRAKVRAASAFREGSNGEWVALPPGVYTTTNMPSILGNGSIRVPGTNLSPTAIVTTPTNGAVLRDDEVVRFRVQPADVDGFIERVEFYLDGVKVRERTNAPFSISLTNVAVGTHSLEAVVFDDDGGSAVSSPILFHVQPRLSAMTSANGVVLEFPVAAKTPYLLQATETLPPAWSNVMTIQSGPARTVFYTNDIIPWPPTRFFRVVSP